MRCHFRKPFLIFRLTRFLEECEIQFLENPSDADRKIGIITPVSVIHQHRIGSDRFPDRFGNGPDLPQIDRIVHLPDGERKAELERIVACRHCGLRFFPDDRGIERTSAPAVDVNPHFIAAFSADQLINRLADSFAENIPERELHTRNRTAFDDAAFPEKLLYHLLREIFDPQRIFADHKGFDILEHAEDGIVVTFQRGFAESV